MLIMPSLTLIAWKLRSNWTLFYPSCGMFCCLKVRWENLVTFCEVRLSWHKVSILSKQGHGMVGEPGVKLGQLPRHGVIEAKLLHVARHLRLGAVGGGGQHDVVGPGHDDPVLLRLLRHLLPPGRVRPESGQLRLPLLDSLVHPHVADLAAGADC